MKLKTLVILLTMLPFVSAKAQKIDWSYTYSTLDPINPMMNISNVDASGNNYWFSYVNQHRVGWTLRSLGDISILRYDSTGNQTGSATIYGNGSVLDQFAIDDRLYARILYYDSLSFDGQIWVHHPSSSRQVFCYFDADMQPHIFGERGDTISAMTIDADHHFVYTSDAGFGGDVNIHIMDTNLNLLSSKNLSGLGYISEIHQKENQAGYIISGSCLDYVDLDNIQYQSPGGYTQYIISIDQNLAGQWIQVTDDITCQRIHSWSNGFRTYMAGNAYTPKDLDGITTAGPNAISDDFFLAALEDTSFVWAQEVPSDTGWYGASITPLPSAMDIDTEGNVYLIGYQRGEPVLWTDSSKTESTHNSEDLVIWSYDIDGQFRWAKSFGGQSFDMGMSLKVLSPDRVFISAVVSDTFTYDGTTYPAAFGDTWVARIDMNGEDTTSTSVKNISADRLKIYPNPSSDFFHVDLPSDLHPIAIYITSSLGQLIYSEPVHPSQRSIQLSSGDLHPGVYIISVSTDQGTLHKSIEVIR